MTPLEASEIGRDAAAEFTAALRHKGPPNPAIVTAVREAVARCHIVEADESLPADVRHAATLRAAELEQLLVMDALVETAVEKCPDVSTFGTPTIVTSSDLCMAIEYNKTEAEKFEPTALSQHVPALTVALTALVTVAIIAAQWSEPLAMALIALVWVASGAVWWTKRRSDRLELATKPQPVLDDHKISLRNLMAMQKLSPSAPQGNTGPIFDALYAADPHEVAAWIRQASPLLNTWQTYDKRDDLPSASIPVVDALAERLSALYESGRAVLIAQADAACAAYTTEQEKRRA